MSIGPFGQYWWNALIVARPARERKAVFEFFGASPRHSGLIRKPRRLGRGDEDAKKSGESRTFWDSYAIYRPV
jgi:hypothetical protein